MIFESVAGEEAGEAGTKTCIDRGYKGDFAVIAEPTNFRNSGSGRRNYLLAKDKEQDDFSRWYAKENDSRRRRIIRGERS